jgi:formylglycine-generating enzyme required for sulfatase activity
MLAESGALATDGLDNNCNRLVDEAGGIMVPVPLQDDVWIDAYEVAVFDSPDCQGTRYGETVDDYPAGWPAEGTPTVTLYACSLRDVIPSGYLSWHRARRACEAQGKRLCTTGEWGAGCTQGQSRFFPYPSGFLPGLCNDAWGGARETRPSGSYPECTAMGGTWDMSGNLGEWVQEWDDDRPGNGVIGGFHHRCDLCKGGIECVPCDPQNDEHREMVADASGCQPRGRAEESYPLGSTEAVLGARCCMDAPP